MRIPTTTEQLIHPTSEAVWDRAIEVFGTGEKAKTWMASRREIFGGRSPEDLIATGDEAELRRILEVLIRIDYGVFS